VGDDPLDHRRTRHRQELLRDGVGERLQPRPPPAYEDDRPHGPLVGGEEEGGEEDDGVAAVVGVVMPTVAGVVAPVTSLGAASSLSDGGLGTFVPAETKARVISWFPFSSILPMSVVTVVGVSSDGELHITAFNDAGLAPHFPPVFSVRLPGSFT